MAQRWQHGSPSNAAQPALASDSAAQPLRAMDSAGETVVVKVYPRKKVSITRSKGHTGYTVNRDNMTIFDVDSGFGAPEGANILAVNGVNVSSWEEYLEMTGWSADDRCQTRIKEWDLHLRLPLNDEQRAGS